MGTPSYSNTETTAASAPETQAAPTTKEEMAAKAKELILQVANSMTTDELLDLTDGVYGDPVKAAMVELDRLQNEANIKFK